MAESVVLLAIERIADLMVQEANFLDDVKEEVNSLKNELERMKSFLKDVDRKQDHDERLRTRVKEIRNLAYDAEDVVESYILKVAHRGGFHGIIKRFSTIFTKPFHRQRIGNHVKAIQTKLMDISASLPAYGISGEGSGASDSAAEMHRRLRRSYPHIEEDDVVSLEVSTKDVLDRLMKKEDQETLDIISIVGMGGLGKTTLAKKVYNHNTVKRYFDCCAWVFISQQFIPREVLHGILIKVKSPSTKLRELIDKLREDELVEMLYDFLKEKRYLVVLDDIWRCEDWDCLKPAFPKGNKGSKLLFTTRNKEVALFADPRSSPIELPLLTDDESWELFRRKAFPDRKMESQACPNEFETMGKEMLKKCGGLPLAIVVLGGLLATKKSWNEWEIVHKNINLHLNKFKQQDYQYGGVNGVLALSYNELPFHLKPCFLYFGHYPEDSEISTKELIRLWIAEGFVSPSMEGEEIIMEDVAEQYIGELTNRCLVQVGKTDHTGRGVKTCRIHDLLRDLCVSKAREEGFFRIVLPPPSTEGNTSCSLHLTATASMARRIAVHPSKRYVHLKGKCPNLRSLLLFQDEEVIRLHISKCSNFRFLRVVKLLRKDSTWWFIPSEIGNLFHLRYLALRCDQVVLPPSLGNLNCLHTFSIQVRYAHYVPWPLFKLEHLRHLLITNGRSSKMWHEMRGCRGANNLRNIETIKYIRVANLSKNNALLTLTNIRSLGIELKRSEDVEALIRSPTFVLSRLRSLHMKLPLIPYPDLGPLSQCHHLSKLRLSGMIQGGRNVLEFLPKNIAKLTLEYSRINQDPMPILEKLPHLRSLCFDLSSFVGTEFSCSANGFPQLDHLEIKYVDVQEWRIEEGAMPRLRILKLEYVKLKMIPEGLKFITGLQEMVLYGAKKSLVKRIQIIDGTEGEEYYKVSHCTSIKILTPQDD